MKHLSLLLAVAAAAATPWSLAHAQTAVQILTAGCADDAKKFCSGVPNGGGRIIACLKQNKDSLSDTCKQAAAKVSAMTAAGPQSPAPAVPATVSTASADAADALIAAPAAPKTKPVHAATASPGAKVATGGAAGSYLVMKKVQITGPGPDAAHPTVPAYDLLIPSTWKIDGGVKFGGSPSGCFSDIFAIGLKATSADGSTAYAAGPDYSWQYADDPSVLQTLNDPKKRALGAGGKPCPVGKPTKAEDYLRQNVLKLYPSGTTVVSVADFPELNEIVRRRIGLPPGNGNTGATRTQAVRMRLAYQQDGKDQEAWVGVGVVVNIYPAGRGSFYDSHATSLVAFSAPKGQLDGNDKLFQVITSSIQPEPQWVTYSSSVVAKLDQAQAQKLATINKIWADFYAKAAQTVNEETANMMHGADVSTFRADQNIRGVQTFRDPTTGKTQELSNLYDSAWQNGSDTYLMSNDPSFNPNGHVSGDWNQLQPVN